MKFTKTIAWSYKHLLKPILFKFDPEFVHDRFLFLGKTLGRFSTLKKTTEALFYYKNPVLEQEFFGIKFNNPVGLSEGFDKDANMVQIMPSVGFGFMQIGSITAKPYEGNPRPRLYRLPKSKAIVVYYGLKNLGVKAVISRLQKQNLPKPFPISVSVAKTNCSATNNLSSGVADYLESLNLLNSANIGDMYTLNISCPNTFGGEPFTDAKSLSALLDGVKTLNIKKPIFIKMPINLVWEDFVKLLDVILAYKCQGVIIGNLNKNHHDPAIIEKIPEQLKGGVSGKPTEKLANALIEKTYKYCGDNLLIIGVGGIFAADDAYKKIKLGASLVQICTGMIFGGPQVIGQINKDLAQMLKKDGFKNVSEAVGKGKSE